MQRLTFPADSDLPADLPPLDSDDEPGAEGPLGDELETLVDLVEDASLDLDDEEAADLDVGLELSEPEGDSDEPRGELVLDIAQLLSIDDDEPSPDDDEAGPESFDPSAGIAVPADDMSGDAELGVDDDESLVSEELPGLDADAEGDFEEPSWAELDTAGDEEPPPNASVAWVAADLAGEQYDAAAMDAAGGRVVLASESGVRWLDDSGALIGEVTLDESCVDVVAADDAGRCALVATVRGNLLWARSDGVEVVELPPELGLRATLPSVGRADGALLCLSAGRLAEGSERSRRLELTAAEGSCLARHAAVVVSGRELWRRQERVWVATPLPSGAARVVEGEELCLAARGSTIVLASRERGAVVSNDGGRTFLAVRGTTGTVAAVAGELDGRPIVVLSLASPMDGSSRIVVVEPGTGRASTVAELPPAPGAEDDEPVARVLAWDGDILWIHGCRGLMALSPPEPPS